MGKSTLNLILVVTITAIGILLPTSLQAVPAAPIEIVLMQPDGEQITVRQWGDENYHGFETTTGRAIIKDGITQQWTYGVMGWDNAIVSSGVRVSNSGNQATVERDFEPHLGRLAVALAPAKTIATLSVEPPIMQNTKESAEFVVPPSGTAGVPVILVNFSDTSTTNTPGQFNTLLFGTGNYSMADYYKEISYNKFSVAAGPSGIGGWYMASRTHDYYGTDSSSIVGSSKDEWPGDLVYEAVAAADDAGYNFANYDRDGDCYVDVVVIVHQGTGQETSGIASDIWSHRWTLSGVYSSGRSHSGAYTTNDTCLTNSNMKVVVNDYTIQPERLGSGMTTMGVIAHEYGHSLGLPDLYDTDSTSQGIGNWSLMAAGNWMYVTTPGDRPAHMDAWSKYKLNWVTPTRVIGALVDQPVKAANAAADVYQFRGGSPYLGSGEYFLVENRQKAGFDAGLPGSGLLIWHIDEAMPNNNNECYPGGPSCAFQHYHVALVQADNYWNLEKNQGRGDSRDPYPGTTNNTSFNATSSPNSNLYSGSASNVSVTYISPSESVMHATLNWRVPPEPDVKANLSDGPIDINPNDVLSLKISLKDIEGTNADWWMIAATPWGHWYYYVYPGKWIDGGLDIQNISFAYQGPLFNLNLFEVLRITGLPIGLYHVYFGVDLRMNGVLDYNILYYDRVIVNVLPSAAELNLHFDPNPAHQSSSSCLGVSPAWNYKATITETAGVGVAINSFTLDFYDTSGNYLNRQTNNSNDFAQWFNTCGMGSSHIGASGTVCGNLCSHLGGRNSGSVVMTFHGVDDNGKNVEVSGQEALLDSGASPALSISPQSSLTQPQGVGRVATEPKISVSP